MPPPFQSQVAGQGSGRQPPRAAQASLYGCMRRVGPWQPCPPPHTPPTPWIAPHLQVWLLGDGLPLRKLHDQAQRLGQLRHHPDQVPLRHWGRWMAGRRADVVRRLGKWGADAHLPFLCRDGRRLLDQSPRQITSQASAGLPRRSPARRCSPTAAGDGHLVTGVAVGRALRHKHLHRHASPPPAGQKHLAGGAVAWTRG
jgi:hypothetical protein